MPVIKVVLSTSSDGDNIFVSEQNGLIVLSTLNMQMNYKVGLVVSKISFVI